MMELRRRTRRPVFVWFAGFIVAVALWIIFLAALIGSSLNEGRMHWLGIVTAVLATFSSGLLWGHRDTARHGNWPGMDPSFDRTPEFDARLVEAPDAEPARWLVESITTFGESVRSLVPPGYEAHARIFHPAWRSTIADRRRGDGDMVSWAEIARSTGRTVHPGMQWPNIAFIDEIGNINDLQDPPLGAPWDSRPKEGSLDEPIARRLTDVLSHHTQTPEHCWFAFWEGWGGLRSDIEAAPSFALPSRNYHLMQGSLAQAGETAYPHEFHYQSASIWWPDDRSWCVVTEVDFETTYIGGTRACIEAILAEPGLESLEIDPAQGITWFSDDVNPSPLRSSDP